MCPDCEARRAAIREAWIKKRLGEMAKEVAKGAAEVVGIKKKTGRADAKKRTRKSPATKPVNSPTGQDTQE